MDWIKITQYIFSSAGVVCLFFTYYLMSKRSKPANEKEQPKNS